MLSGATKILDLTNLETELSIKPLAFVEPL